MQGNVTDEETKFIRTLFSWGLSLWKC